MRHLSPSGLHAMAVYLPSLPAKHTEGGGALDQHSPALVASTLFTPPPGETRGCAAGLRLYEEACASCHGRNGEGLKTPYGAQTVNDPSATNLIQVILHGPRIQTANGLVEMPAFGGGMTNAEIAATANYVLAHFGNKRPSVTPGRVAKARVRGE